MSLFDRDEICSGCDFVQPSGARSGIEGCTKDVTPDFIKGKCLEWHHTWKDAQIKAMHDALIEECDRAEVEGRPAPQTMAEHKEFVREAFRRKFGGGA